MRPILYIKSGCPWCREALSFFNSHGVDLDVRDVLSSPKDMDAMVSVSGQTLTPTFEYEDFMVADQHGLLRLADDRARNLPLADLHTGVTPVLLRSDCSCWMSCRTA